MAIDIGEVPDDPDLAVLKLCQLWHDFRYSDRAPDLDDRSIAEFYALILVMGDTYDLNFTGPPLGNGAPIDRMRIFLDSQFEAIQKRTSAKIRAAQIDESTERFTALLGRGFCYEFADADLKRIQKLINELRDLVTQSDQIEEKHKARILRRLERLQSELHKKVADLDRFWGLIGDAGVMLRKLGHDAKPMVDRIREIADIVWHTQSLAEGLPSSSASPLLTFDDSKKDGDQPQRRELLE